MEYLILGSILTLFSLLVGYNLGKHQSITPPDMQKKINQIFKKVIPDKELGPITRPTAEDNFRRDNPQIAQEQDIMRKEFEVLNK